MSDNFTIKSALDTVGVVSINPKGRSMYPYIRESDTVVIVRPKRQLKKYDCVLFFGHGNVYILHRLMKMDEKFAYTLGDNNFAFDKPVPKEDVVGVLEGFYRRGKYHAVYDKKISLRVKLGCFKPFKVVRIYFFRLVGRAIGLLGRVKNKRFKKAKKEDKTE